MPPVYVAVHVPEFPTQTLSRLREQLRGKPVAVLEGERPFERVCSLNRKARRLGVRSGMTRAEVEPFSVTLTLRSAGEEASARAVLQSVLERFTPGIEEQPEDVAWAYVLDMSGTERLSGALPSAAETIRTHLSKLYFEVRIAISENFHAALYLARSTHREIIHVPRGAQRRFLSRLPLRSLPMREEDAEILSGWGLRTLGELAELPEIDLIARLGQEGRRLRQLACGEHTHLFQPLQAALALEEYVEFDAPVEMLESLLFAINPMLEQLMKRAASRSLAIASVTIACGHEAAPPHTRSVRTALPTEDRRVLLKLLQLDLEAHPPAAGVTSIRLTADPGPISKLQTGLFSPQLPEPMRLDVTLARVAAIVGEGCVGRPVLGDTHRADAFTMERFTTDAGTQTGSQPRPSFGMRRFRPPAEVKVELVNGRLKTFWHQRVRYDVNRLYGPWRTSGDWWSGEIWSRDGWDFAAETKDGSLLVGIAMHDRLRRVWELEALYD